MNFSDFDIIIVGAGFFGATIAERCAADLNKRVLVIERRSHIGGNAYSEICNQTGVEVHKYGAHLFHTSNDTVWNYINKFSDFTQYKHKVFTSYKNQVFSMPINLGTICQFFGKRFTPEEAKELIKEQAGEFKNLQPSNLEEKAISLIGKPLYEAFIRGYTAKQWQTDPLDLSASIINRLPVRYNFDNSYFNDIYEGLPTLGYTAIFEKMLLHPNIKTCVNLDYLEMKSEIDISIPVVYTGPIDKYFNNRAGELTWRTIDFDSEILNVNDFQGTSVMNYADENVPFTRIIEFKHFHPERDYCENKTHIVREYARFAKQDDEPYYPINTLENKKIYRNYQDLSKLEKNVIFGGRLGTYKYLDMHQAIGAALKCYESEVMPILLKNNF